MMHGGFGMGWMWIWPVALIVLVLVVIRALTAPSGPARSASAEEILKRRYARGEIDDEEYKRRLEELRRTGQ